jgi:hypothetical protein
VNGHGEIVHGAKAPSLSFKEVCGTTEVVPFRTPSSDSGFFSSLRGVKLSAPSGISEPQLLY